MFFLTGFVLLLNESIFRQKLTSWNRNGQIRTRKKSWIGKREIPNGMMLQWNNIKKDSSFSKQTWLAVDVCLNRASSVEPLRCCSGFFFHGGLSGGWIPAQPPEPSPRMIYDRRASFLFAADVADDSRRQFERLSPSYPVVVPPTTPKRRDATIVDLHSTSEHIKKCFPGRITGHRFGFFYATPLRFCSFFYQRIFKCFSNGFSRSLLYC